MNEQDLVLMRNEIHMFLNRHRTDIIQGLCNLLGKTKIIEFLKNQGNSNPNHADIAFGSAVVSYILVAEMWDDIFKGDLDFPEPRDTCMIDIRNTAARAISSNYKDGGAISGAIAGMAFGGPLGAVIGGIGGAFFGSKVNKNCSDNELFFIMRQCIEKIFDDISQQFDITFATIHLQNP